MKRKTGDVEAIDNGETDILARRVLSSFDGSALFQFYDGIQHALRHFPLCGFGNLDCFIAGENGDRIAVGVKANALAGDVVDDDGVERFGGQLLPGVLEHVFGFSGESNDELVLLCAREFRRECRALAPVLDVIGPLVRLIFCVGCGFGAVVSHGCGLDDDGGFGQKL